MLRTTLLFSAALVGGCAASMPTTQMVAVDSMATATCAADLDCGSQQLCVDRGCHDVSSVNAAACGDLAVHFATNSAAIDARNRPELNRTALCLRTHKDVRVNLGGNADERGAADHNRDLAQRRADAVAGYLETAGVPAAQLGTATYGADNPECIEHDAECWRTNRRVDIQPHAMRANAAGVKNKLTTDDDAKNNQRITGTGNGTENGTGLGK